MFTEDDLLPLSALQHVVFCARQCALIHVEQQWKENSLTLEGKRLHNRTDATTPCYESRGDVVIARGLALRSFTLGVSGRSDVVELHRCMTQDDNAASMPGLEGLWSVFPIEYKRGKSKQDRCDEVQLCAQAICLEEMLNVQVEKGALFYGTQKRRYEVEIDLDLRETTRLAAAMLRDMMESGTTPTAVEGPRCVRCSLNEICMPRITGGRRSVQKYIERNVLAQTKEDG